jgi:hypothetical protein
MDVILEQMVLKRMAMANGGASSTGGNNFHQFRLCSYPDWRTEEHLRHNHGEWLEVPVLAPSTGGSADNHEESRTVPYWSEWYWSEWRKSNGTVLEQMVLEQMANGERRSILDWWKRLPTVQIVLLPRVANGGASLT